MVTISVCIPAYNRYQFMDALLDSILKQDYPGLEIVICEDMSPERELIRHAVVSKVKDLNLTDKKLKYFENERNLGYDSNFRNLLNKASGDYCMFMGNDDLLAPGSIERLVKVLEEHNDVAVVSRAYQWFANDSKDIQETINYLPNDTLYAPGIDAIKFFYRRVGVLSGLVFRRKPAIRVATDIFDGHLYYQMYLAGMLLQQYGGFYISTVQTLSRDGIEPDFGNADVEKAKFRPGSYSYEGRVHMVEGLLKIANHIDRTADKRIFRAVKRDIATYFYPYIRDQLDLSARQYIDMIRSFRDAGMTGEVFFYLHCVVAFVLKKKGLDTCIKYVRKLLGHTPRLGI